MPVKLFVKKSVKESVVEQELVRRVLALGGRCEKVVVLGARGFFDRLIVLPGGRIIFAELKRPRGGRLSAHQEMYRDNFRALGAVVALVKTSADIDALLKKYEGRRGAETAPASMSAPSHP